MARYTGPRARVSRRLGTNIWGTRGENKAMEKRPFPPGQHGRTRRRGTASEYSMQLAEKQKARFTYGLNERQFRNIYLEASRRDGVTGLNMLQYLELRLDNIVYRAAWAATRPQARQAVSHGHVEVNGKRVNIASYRVRKGDVVSLRPKARESVDRRTRWRDRRLHFLRREIDNGRPASPSICRALYARSRHRYAARRGMRRIRAARRLSQDDAVDQQRP